MKSFTVESFPWDAGTDSGTTYAAADMATNPVGLISKITSGVLLAPGADSVEAAANWECATTTTDISATMIGTFEDGTISEDMPVSYSCKLYNKLTEEYHPTDFPSNNHWSPSLLVSHSVDYSMWSGNTKATSGVKLIAEVCILFIYV